MTPSSPVWYMLIMGSIAMLPFLIACGTSYLKVSVVLGILRSVLGGVQIPGSIATVAFSFLISLSTMLPVIRESGASIDWSKLPAVGRDLTLLPEVLDKASMPYRSFLKKWGSENDRRALRVACEEVENQSIDPERFDLLVLGFMVGELKRGCVIGLALLIPFLVIDVVVANILMAMGMVMVSPSVISLPLKLALLVIGNGWTAIVESMIRSYN